MLVRGKRFLSSFFIDIALLAISIVLEVPLFLTLAIMLWVIGVEYAVSDLKNRAAFLLFLISFFVFLLGSEVAVHFLGYPEEYKFSIEINNHAYICLCISLIGLIIGFQFASSFIIGKRRMHNSTSSSTNQRVVTVAKYGMLITFIPYLAEAIVSGIYVLRNGYLAYYVSYSSSLPGLVTQLSEFFTLFLFLFLATMPKKKDTYPFIGVYLIHGIVMLLTGRRLYFGMAIFMLAAYFLIRHNRDQQEKWITNRLRFVVIIGVPVIVILLYAYKYVRYDLDVIGSGYLDLFIRFFNQQGISVNVIKYAKQYGGEELGTTSLYYTLKYLRSGVLTRWIYNFPVEYYKMRTAASAYHTNSMADFIMYNYSSYQYAKGYGLGTSYIAELYHDGGYITLFLGSIFYGWLMARLFSLRSENVWRYTLAFMMLEQFMILPRYGADAILRPFYNLTKIIIFIAIYLGVNYVGRSRSVERLE